MGNKKFRNLVFSGGGTKGVAFLGVLLYLCENEYKEDDIDKIGGTSIGALFSFLLCIGYKFVDLVDLLLYKMPDFVDSYIDNINYLKLLNNLINKNGVIDTDDFDVLLLSVIAEKVDPNITFKELYELTGKELVIICTDINNLKIRYFHHHKYPDITVRHAVYASCCYPVAFATKFLTINDESIQFSDGALIENFAIEMFNNMSFYYSDDDSIDLLDYETNPETLGIAFKNYNSLNDNSNGKPAKNLYDFLTNKIVQATGVGVERKRYTKNLEKQAIFIDIGTEISSFDLANIKSPERILDLIHKGKKSSEDFFKSIS